jgi:glucose-6-phosphate dehydrogenase assembly protein OpcA
MSTTYKVLGQSAPAATTDATLYTVPSSTNTIVSSIVVANRASSSATYRVAIRPAGASIANEHYIAYDIPLDGNDSTSLTLGLTLEATDVITVRASSASCSFSAFGSEVS